MGNYILVFDHGIVNLLIYVLVHIVLIWNDCRKRKDLSGGKAKGHLQTMNYFNLKTAAERYSKGRPDFQSNTIKHVKDYLHFDKKLNNALDIACGTLTRDTPPPVLTTNGIIRMA